MMRINWPIIVVFGLVAAGFYLRLEYMRSGLYFVLNPDEARNFNTLQAMLANRDPNPHFFRYPSLIFYLSYPGLVIANWLNGGISAIHMLTMGTGIVPQPAGLLVARIPPLLLGSGLIAVPLIGLKTGRPHAIAAVLAAVPIAFSPLLIRHSAYFTPDIVAAFFVTAALFFATDILRSPTGRTYVATGILLGLAASAKYNAGAAAVALIAAHFLRFGPSYRPLSKLLLAGCAALLTLVATSPYLALDFGNALKGFLFEFKHYQTGHWGAQGDTLKTNLTWVWGQTGWGAPLALGVLVSRNRRRFLPILAFVLVYLVLISTQTVRFERNILLLLPALFFLIAAGTLALIEKLVRVKNLDLLVKVALTTTVLAISYQPPFERSLLVRRYFNPDPRKDTRIWLEKIMPDNARVVLDAYSPFLAARNRQIDTANLVLTKEFSWFDGADFVVISRPGSMRFLGAGTGPQKATFERLSAAACTIKRYPQKRAYHLVLKMRCANNRSD